MADFQKELDKRRYVSLSRDKKWTEEELEKQEEPDRLGLPDEEQMSLFDVRMPGVMTIEEVKSQIDLDHWGLLVEGTLVEMCVSYLTSPQLMSVNQDIDENTGPGGVGEVGYHEAACNQGHHGRTSCKPWAGAFQAYDCDLILMGFPFIYIYTFSVDKKAFTYVDA